MSAPLQIRDNPEYSRFELDVEGARSIAQYTLGEGTMTFTHTLVPVPLRGRGIGTRLVEAALAAARQRRVAVVPQCSMFLEYMRRHPDTHELLAPAGRRLLGL